MKNFLKIWLNVLLAVSAVLALILVYNWNDYTWVARLSFIGFAFIGIHALEEEKYPGGFMYLINTTIYTTDKPDRYPMNQYVAMLVDFSVMLVYALIFFASNGATWFGVSIAAFCLIELVVHLQMGMAVYKRFRSRGKRTIYNPGLFTTVFGFLPIGAAILALILNGNLLSWTEWLLGLFTTVVVIAIFVKGIEAKFCDKNTPYISPREQTYGYFMRFMNEDDYANPTKIES